MWTSKGDNDLGPEGAKVLAPTLSKLKSLTELSLRILQHHSILDTNHIEADGAVAIAGAIKGLLGLRVLYVRNIFSVLCRLQQHRSCGRHGLRGCSGCAEESVRAIDPWASSVTIT